jgi:Flp pilus assembly protein TadB
MLSVQDIILTIGSLILGAAIIPSVVSKHKPALLTSIMTGVVLLIFAVVYASLELWFTVATTTVTACLWLTMAVQKKRQTRR